MGDETPNVKHCSWKTGSGTDSFVLWHLVGSDSFDSAYSKKEAPDMVVAFPCFRDCPDGYSKERDIVGDYAKRWSGRCHFRERAKREHLSY